MTLFGLVSACLLASQAAGAASIPYPLTGAASFRTTQYSISRDGQYVVFKSSAPAGLYSAPISGASAPTLLGTPQADFFVLAPDSSRVVFLDDLETPGLYELFSIPITGGTPQKLSGVFGHAAGVHFQTFKFSPDSAWVVYLANQDSNEYYELYSVAAGGGAPVKLNGALTGSDDVNFFYAISPDSTRTVFGTLERHWSVPIGGGVATGFTASPVDFAYGYNRTVAFDPTGAWVVLHGYTALPGPAELFRAPIAGGMATRISGPMVASTPGVDSGFGFGADGSRVVYRANAESASVTELFSVPLSGGPAVKLNGALTTNGHVESFMVGADGATVFYLADQETDSVSELYSVSILGGPVTKLSAPLGAQEDVTFFNAGLRNGPVIYLVRDSADSSQQHFRVPLTGGTATPLSPEYYVTGAGTFSAPNAAGTHLYFSAELDTAGVTELYEVSLTGGSPVKVNEAMVSGGDILTVIHAFTSAHLVYRADQRTDGVLELFVVKVMHPVAYLPLVARP